MSRKAKAVVVGGSIAGVSTAHALLSAGWDVTVLEKSRAPPTRSPTGAGLGLDPLARRITELWLDPIRPGLLHSSTMPLTIDQNQVTDDKNIRRILARDENFNFRAAYWSDFYNLLYLALPQHVVYWGHLFLSFYVSHDKKSVTVKTKLVQTGEIVEIVGDLLVAADGCLSSIRQNFLPSLKLKYSGYCAWRGVFDFSGNENSETMIGIRRAYPDLGKCLYFDLGLGTHVVLYELLNNRINWIWYVNQPEPELKGNSMTMNVSGEMVQAMKEEAEKVWFPELARVIKETKEPFINIICDCDPLKHLFWDSVVLVGDAAHPTTPHGLRSTNMSILDAAVLGKCLEKWGPNNVQSALEEYEEIRLPVVAKQVLHARRLGRIKQGLVLPDRKPLIPEVACPEDYEELQQKCMPFFGDVPSLLNLI